MKENVSGCFFLNTVYIGYVVEDNYRTTV